VKAYLTLNQWLTMTRIHHLMVQLPVDEENRYSMIDYKGSGNENRWSHCWGLDSIGNLFESNLVEGECCPDRWVGA